MKLFTGWVISAGLVLMAGPQMRKWYRPMKPAARYIAVSDIDGPYAAMPPEAPAPG